VDEHLEAIDPAMAINLENVLAFVPSEVFARSDRMVWIVVSFAGFACPCLHVTAYVVQCLL
jgi:hypothetical protein